MTWVNFGRRAKKNSTSNGSEQIIDTTAKPPSPSINPNKVNAIVLEIINSSNTIPSILQITLHGDDLDANASPFGGGVSGAITGCMNHVVSIH